MVAEFQHRRAFPHIAEFPHLRLKLSHELPAICLLTVDKHAAPLFLRLCTEHEIRASIALEAAGIAEMPRIALRLMRNDDFILADRAILQQCADALRRNADIVLIFLVAGIQHMQRTILHIAAAGIAAILVMIV